MTGCDAEAARYLKDIYGAEDLPGIVKHQPENVILYLIFVLE